MTEAYCTGANGRLLNCDTECESFFEPGHCSHYRGKNLVASKEKEYPEDLQYSGPAHYTYGQVECWDWYEMAMTPEEFRGAMKNNVWKYTFRAGRKGSAIPDLKKAIAYLKRWIEYEEGWRHHAIGVQKTIDAE